MGCRRLHWCEGACWGGGAQQERKCEGGGDGVSPRQHATIRVVHVPALDQRCAAHACTQLPLIAKQHRHNMAASRTAHRESRHSPGCCKCDFTGVMGKGRRPFVALRYRTQMPEGGGWRANIQNEIWQLQCDFQIFWDPSWALRGPCTVKPRGTARQLPGTSAG